MNGDVKVLDLEVARRLLPGGEDGIRGIAALTRDECPKHLADARAAFEHDDAQVVYRAAHSLKATFGWFGAVAAVEAARLVEGSARDGDLVAARDAFPHLEAEGRRFVEALATLHETLTDDEATDAGGTS